MNWSNSEPGNLFPTVSYQSNYSELLEVNDILVNSIKMIGTDSVIGITITGGTIDGITRIENSSDAVNKQYIINSKKPSGPVDSIQYNDNGVFNGSSKLLFTGDFNKGSLITNGINISDSIVVISSGQILNAPDPIYDSQLATKNYVDFFKNYTNTISIRSSISETYPSITNNIIRRNMNQNIQDYLPTAQNIFIDLIETNIQAKSATTSNITLQGLQTIDGVVLLNGDIMLVKNQNVLKENGIYTVKTGLWTQSSQNMFDLKIYVLGGTTNSNKIFTTSNTAYDSQPVINDILFEEINILKQGFFYEFGIINESTSSTLSISTSGTGSGVSIVQYNSSIYGPIILPPNYVVSGLLTVTNLNPPAISMLLTSNKQGIRYLDSNFIPNTFQTQLSYRITNTFMVPGPSTIIENTSVGYLYTSEDVSKNIIVRNPGSNSNDGFDNLLRNSSVSIQNISSNTINISSTNSVGVWTFEPSPIIIGPGKVQKILLYTESGQNYATGLGQTNY